MKPEIKMIMDFFFDLNKSKKKNLIKQSIEIKNLIEIIKKFQVKKNDANSSRKIIIKFQPWSRKLENLILQLFWKHSLQTFLQFQIKRKRVSIQRDLIQRPIFRPEVKENFIVNKFVVLKFKEEQSILSPILTSEALICLFVIWRICLKRVKKNNFLGPTNEFQKCTKGLNCKMWIQTTQKIKMNLEREI